MWPLMSGARLLEAEPSRRQRAPPSGDSGCSRRRGLLKVSSRNGASDPLRAPPAAFSGSRRLRRCFSSFPRDRGQPHTETTLSSCAQAGHRLTHEFLLVLADFTALLRDFAKRATEGGQHLAENVAKSNIKSTASRVAAFDKRGPSSSRMKRVAAIQKSFAAFAATHCTRPPSHCFQGLHQFRASCCFLAWSHCSNWSRAQSISSSRLECPDPMRARQRFLQVEAMAGSPGQRLRNELMRRISVSPALPLPSPGSCGGGRGRGGPCGGLPPHIPSTHRPKARGSKPAFTSDDLPQPLGP